ELLLKPTGKKSSAAAGASVSAESAAQKKTITFASEAEKQQLLEKFGASDADPSLPDFLLSDAHLWAWNLVDFYLRMCNEYSYSKIPILPVPGTITQSVDEDLAKARKTTENMNVLFNELIRCIEKKPVGALF
ncbi:hypothetical protein PMAYCL1PPCAC_00491, partial [Pristionchus mayeri]